MREAQFMINLDGETLDSVLNQNSVLSLRFTHSTGAIQKPDCKSSGFWIFTQNLSPCRLKFGT